MEYNRFYHPVQFIPLSLVIETEELEASAIPSLTQTTEHQIFNARNIFNKKQKLLLTSRHKFRIIYYPCLIVTKIRSKTTGFPKSCRGNVLTPRYVDSNGGFPVFYHSLTAINYGLLIRKGTVTFISRFAWYMYVVLSHTVTVPEL